MKQLAAAMIACLGLITAMGCATAVSERPSPLTVFAAASLSDAFTELGTVFTNDNPQIPITFNFAGSNQLATQIAAGAPADVFASANGTQMAAAVAGGRIDPAAPVRFLTNRLAIIVPQDNPAQITQLADLANEEVLLVLAAPEVPVGQYARDFLAKASDANQFGAGFRDSVMANLVSSEQNVRAVLTKVALGEADAGIVYRSDATGSGGDVAYLDIPDDLNIIAEYPIAMLNDTPHAESAQAFVAFVLSPAGQAILANHGFSPVTAP